MKINRRNFIKVGGLISGALGIGGIAGAGIVAGANAKSYTGWDKNNLEKDLFFNRKPFYTDKPMHNKVGESRRIAFVEDIFKRNDELYHLMYSKNKEIKSTLFTVATPLDIVKAIKEGCLE